MLGACCRLAVALPTVAAPSRSHPGPGAPGHCSRAQALGVALEAVPLWEGASSFLCPAGRRQKAQEANCAPGDKRSLMVQPRDCPLSANSSVMVFKTRVSRHVRLLADRPITHEHGSWSRVPSQLQNSCASSAGVVATTRPCGANGVYGAEFSYWLQQKNLLRF